MINWTGLWTLTNREVGRFFSVYRQTVIPGLISSVLYILIFGFTLEQRISEIQGVSYTMFILPGLIMMNTLTNASSNTSSSMLQMKLLQQLPDLLTAPLSGLEIALAYIIGGTVRGMVNGILVLLVGVILIDLPISNLPGTLMFIFLVSWAFSSMGLVMGQLAESWDQLAMIQNFFLTPLPFVTNACLAGGWPGIGQGRLWGRGVRVYIPLALHLSAGSPSSHFVLKVRVTFQPNEVMPAEPTFPAPKSTALLKRPAA